MLLDCLDQPNNCGHGLTPILRYIVKSYKNKQERDQGNQKNYILEIQHSKPYFCNKKYK